MTTWITSHAAAGVAFAVLTALLLVSSRRRGVALSLIAAACASSLWGFALAAAPMVQALYLIPAAEALRMAGWMFFLFHLVARVHGRSTTTTALAILATGLVLCAAAAPLVHVGSPGLSRLLLPMLYACSGQLPPV